MPYCFWRSYVKFQAHMRQKIDNIDPIWALPDCNSKFEFTDDYEMMHEARRGTGDVPYCFSMSSAQFRGHGR